MKYSTLLRNSASMVVASFVLAGGVAHATPTSNPPAPAVVVDGTNGTGTVVVTGTRTEGNSEVETIYTNYTTVGGMGSGGGGGLGGVFFVNENATLTLNNVSFKSNVAKGGEGGSAAQVSLGNIVIALPKIEVAAAAVDFVGGSPLVTVTNGVAAITGMTASGTNGVVGAGAAVRLSGLSGTALVSNVSGSTVNFVQPVQITSANILGIASGINLESGSTAVTVSGVQNDVNALRVGMTVYGDGIAAGTVIQSVTRGGSNNNVISVVLSQPTTAAITAYSRFSVVNIQDFTASRIAGTTGSNTVRPLGQLTGFLVGMEVSGSGIANGTRITAIANDGTLTLSTALTGPVSGLTAVTIGAAVGSNVISLGGARSDLAVGMAVTGAGIPDGTTISSISGSRVTLSNAVTSDAASAIASNSFAAAFGKVISSTNSTLTLASIDGLAVGALLSGTGVPTNARITAINESTKVVTYVIDNDAAALQVGGSMNALVSTGNGGSNGNNGPNGSMYNAVLHDGEGAEGRNGYSGGAGTNAAGGTGGRGGNGSAGLPYNADAILGVTGATFGAIDDTAGLVADFADLSFARAVVQTAKVVQAWIDVGIAISDLTAWNIDLAAGTVGLGGDGGSGGNGGDGSGFFGGGTGGAGGDGGNGALSFTDGGAGGDGGSGGTGAFGAGGGSGGAAGTQGSTGAASLGGAGDGGNAGFGGGVGTSGDGTGGGGGSGYGGAIFVRTGGTLTVTGDSLFENNNVYAGSSNNGGEAGQAVGTDLFMMRGSNVTLSPGAGNVIRFEGSIADDSAASIDGAAWASGNGANIQITGDGLVQFAGENSYSGQTRIGGATLEADIGAGIHSDSRLVFNGVSTIGASLANATAGVLLTSGDINTRVGTLAGQTSWNGSGGFAAQADGLTLNFGAITPTSGQSLTWNAGGFVTTGSTLMFGSTFGTGLVTMVNNINLAGQTGRIAVLDNTAADTDAAVMAGVLRNGGLIVNDTGYAGALYFTNQNELNALTVRNGIVSTKFEDVTGRLMASSGGSLNVLNGAVYLHSDERLLGVNIAAPGIVNAFADVTAADVVNAGIFAIEGTATVANITNSGLITFASEADTGTINNSDRLAFAAGGSTGAITNSGALLAVGDMVTGAISNTGTISFANAVSSANINNSGDILFGAASSVGSVTNAAEGSLFIKGDMAASGAINNIVGGTVYLAANIDTQSTFTNDGLLVVVGNTVNGVETAASRRIITTGFQDPTGVVNLGGVTGNIANALMVYQLGDSLYSGTFIGAGSFEKSGGGALTLNGENTFTGGLAINQGTLDTTGGGTFANTVDATVAAGATFIVGTNDEVRSISNRGTLLANANIIVTSLTNSGTTRMNADFGARGNVSNAASSMLTFTSGNEAIVAGNLTNAGTLMSEAAFAVGGNLSNAAGATLNLLNGGSNSFGSLTNSGAITADTQVTVSGAYVQNAGLFTANANMSTGSLSGTGGNIRIGANTLTVNQTANGSYAGGIAGTGSVVKTGTATLTLAGSAGSFAPSNLMIQQGTVAVNGAGILDSALSVSVSSGANLSLVTGNQTIRNLTGNGSLLLSGNNLYLELGGDFAGTVTGTGNVQVNSGSFNLSNVINSTAGTFSVQNNSTMNVGAAGILNAPTVNVTGRLDVQGIVNTATTNVVGELHLGNGNGTVAGTLLSTTTNVNGGGTLTGVGSVSGTINVGGLSGGSLSPGNSPGTMSVANLTLGDRSTTTMEIEGAATGSYDRINLTGTLALQAGSTLNIANSNTFEMNLGQTVKIFNVLANSVTGQFGTVTSNFARSVAYNVATGTVVGLGTLNGATFEAQAAETANDSAMLNQLRVATNGGVNQYYGGRLIEHVSAALATGNDDATSEAFAKASPEVYTGLNAHLKISMLDNRPKLGGYAQVDKPTYYATGSFTTTSNRNEDEDGYARFKSSGQHFNIGAAAQYEFGRAEFSYARANGNLNGDYLRGDITGDQFSAGLSAPFALDGAVRFQARVAYGDYRLKGARVTNAGVAKFSDVDGSAIVYGFGLEYLKTGKTVSVAGTLELLGGRTNVAAINEAGADAFENLTVNKQRDDFSLIAGNIEVAYQVAPTAQILLNMSLDQDLDTRMKNITAQVGNEATNFTVSNPALTATRVKAGFGTRINLADNILWSSEANIGNTASYGYKTSLSIRF